MNSQQYLEDLKNVQEKLLIYLDNNECIEENYQNLNNLLNNIKSHNNKYELKSFVILLLNISNNHYREVNFFDKIESIIKIIKDDLNKNFTNLELFHLFFSNNRILLFILEEKIIIMDVHMVKEIILNCKIRYFQPEIQHFVNEDFFSILFNCTNKYHDLELHIMQDIIQNVNTELPDNFCEKIKIGENDDIICELIRRDAIKEFIVYINKNPISIKSKFTPSIYETNSLLLKNMGTTLIEYAAFF